MPSYSPTNLYRPTVRLKTDQAAGIQAAGNAIAGIFSTIDSRRREDQIRTEDRQAATASRQAIFAQQDARDARQRGNQLSDRAALFARQDDLLEDERDFAKEQKELETAARAEAAAGGVAAMASLNLLDASAVQFFDQQPDSAKEKVGDLLLKMAGLKAAEMAKQREREARETPKLIMDPETGQALPGYLLQSGQLVPRGAAGGQPSLSPGQISGIQIPGLDLNRVTVDDEGRPRAEFIRPQNAGVTGDLIFGK